MKHENWFVPIRVMALKVNSLRQLLVRKSFGALCFCLVMAAFVMLPQSTSFPGGAFPTGSPAENPTISQEPSRPVQAAIQIDSASSFSFLRAHKLPVDWQESLSSRELRASFARRELALSCRHTDCACSLINRHIRLQI